MIVLAAILAAGATQPFDLQTLAGGEARMQVSECTGKACFGNPAERYRLSGYDPEHDPGAKERAWADDGSYCGVIGDKYCPSSRFPVIRSGESPVHTILRNLPFGG